MHTVSDPCAGPRLLVGPVLRYVDASRATIWVETDRPCRVEVLGTTTPTWSVHGHHYALVELDGLAEAGEHAYQVHLDGTPVWPEAGSPFPPSVIRTPAPDGTFRLAFGSCRRAAPFDPDAMRRFGADALVALAEQMAARSPSTWPDALFLVGDQVYADLPSDALAGRLRAAHADADADHAAVADEIWDFEEYTWLYAETWTPAPVRWLLSTVPSCMLLDDHDLRDDWNTSVSWRRDVTGQAWWHDRVVGAFGSYWVYQHLGNLCPEQLATDETYAMVRSVDDDAERTRLLDELAWRSDAAPETIRWSFARDFGNDGMRVRLIAVDTRCSRVLDPDRRAMVDEDEWDWVVSQASADGPAGAVDHLLVGTTLPLLLPHGIHHFEGWNEAVSEGAWGRWAARAAEWLRRLVDLEHWAAFRRSFDRVVELLARVVGGEQPPASVLVLSGDVHCSYLARARLSGVEHPGTAVHQLTMSPFRNPLHLPLRLANKVAEVRGVRWLAHRLARSAGVRDVAVDWDLDGGPWFDNGVMTVLIEGRSARALVERADTVDDPAHDADAVGPRQVLRRTAEVDLTP